MWGPIGLSLMIAIGRDAFHAFLRGAQSMDRHFCDAEFHENLPVLLALVGIGITKCAIMQPVRAAL